VRTCSRDMQEHFKISFLTALNSVCQEASCSYTCGPNCFFSQSTPKSVKGSTKKEGSKRKINMSGYILFSSEMRAVIKAQHPDYSFGELSRLVGTEWRNLEATKKAEYEGK